MLFLCVFKKTIVSLWALKLAYYEELKCDSQNENRWSPCVFCVFHRSHSHMGVKMPLFFGVICSVFPDPPPERQWTIPSMFASITFFFCVCYWLCVCVCVMPLVCSFICSSSFSITSLAFTLAVNAVWLQSLVGKWKVCLCWTMSWTLTSHLTSTQGCDWTCYPAEGLQVTW